MKDEVSSHKAGSQGYNILPLPPSLPYPLTSLNPSTPQPPVPHTISLIKYHSFSQSSIQSFILEEKNRKGKENDGYGMR